MRAFPLISLLALLTLAADTAKAEDTSLCEKAKEAARSGDHTKAVGRFNGCIQLGKLRTEALADAYFERGKSLLQLGRLNPALTDFNQTVGMRYKLDESYFHRALIFARAHKHGLAIVEYGRALLIKPEDPKLYYNRALSHMATHDHQKALADLDKVEKLDQNYVGALDYNRGIVFAKLKLYDKATTAFDQSIHRRWNLAIRYPSQGLNLLKAKQHDLAVANLNYAIVLRPNFGDAYTYRGLAREGQKKTALALGDYRKALEFDTTVEWTAKRIEQLRY